MTTCETSVDFDSLAWGEPQITDTRRGPRRLRDVPIRGEHADEIFRLYRDGELKPLGYSVSKVRGEWTLTEWRLPDGSMPEPAPIEHNGTAPASQPGEPVQTLNREETGRLGQISGLLLPWQAAAVESNAAALKAGGTIDASDTGTGKTFAIVAAALVLGRPLFAVCPKAVIPAWIKAAEHFGMQLEGCINYEMLKTGKTDFLKIEEGTFRNRPTKRFVWKLRTGTIIAFDECHRLKSYVTANAKMGVAAILQGFTVAGISATCADNPTQMQFVGLVAKLIKTPGEFYPWMLANGVRRGRFGMEYKGGAAGLKKIHAKIFPARGTRIRISDLKDFPPTQIAAEAYDCGGETGDIQRAYDEMREEIAKLKSKEDQDAEKNISAMILVEQLRARQRTEILKVPTITALAQDQAEEGMSVCIFVNFDDVLLSLINRLDAQLFIRGGQTPLERQWMIERFQADKERFIICNIQAGGVGISLHGAPDGRHRYSIICPTFSAQALKQCFGRPWRAGGAPSIQRIIYAAGTIEETICRKVRAKMARIDALNDGDLMPQIQF